MTSPVRGQGLQVTVPDDLPALGELVGMTACVIIKQDPDVPKSKTEACANIDQVTKWTTPGGRQLPTNLHVRMSYPAQQVVWANAGDYGRPHALVTNIYYVPSRIFADIPTTTGWVATIEFVGSEQEIVRRHGIPIDVLTLFPNYAVYK